MTKTMAIPILSQDSIHWEQTWRNVTWCTVTIGDCKSNKQCFYLTYSGSNGKLTCFCSLFSIIIFFQMLCTRYLRYLLTDLNHFFLRIIGRAMNFICEKNDITSLLVPIHCWFCNFNDRFCAELDRVLQMNLQQSRKYK